MFNEYSSDPQTSKQLTTYFRNDDVIIYYENFVNFDN